MPTPPSRPPLGSDEVRQTMLFRVLRKGREKKLARPLTEGELRELEAHAARTANAGVHVAKNRSVSEAAKAAVASLPKVLPEKLLGAPHKLKHHQGSRDLTRAARRRGGRTIENVGVLLQMAVADGRRGPQLPAYARRTSALYIQQDDLDTFIPDGWGKTFTAEAGAMGRATGLPFRAIPLLCLLSWTSSFRPAMTRDRNECGAGFQVSLDWLARKLGCSRVWVQALLNRMDPYASWRREMAQAKRQNRRRSKQHLTALELPEKPTGTAYVHRFRRLKRYEDTCPEAARRRIWIDSKGKPHVYVDVRGVVYLTQAGRKILGRPRSRLDASHDVDRGGIRSRWLLSARLRRGHNLLTGGHVVEVLENRLELLGAPDVPKNLSPNNSTLRRPPPS